MSSPRLDAVTGAAHPNNAKIELDEAALLLLRAADWIEKRGLCKRHFADSAGALCIQGAINMAHHGSYEGLFDALQREAFGDWEVIQLPWNDDPSTTAEEVIEVLRRVALEGK